MMSFIICLIVNIFLKTGNNMFKDITVEILMF